MLPAADFSLHLEDEGAPSSRETLRTLAIFESGPSARTSPVTAARGGTAVRGADPASVAWRHLGWGAAERPREADRANHPLSLRPGGQRPGRHGAGPRHDARASLAALTSMTTPELRRAAEVLRSSNALLIGAGAGMGVDSGLPDFRGTEGFWKRLPRLREARPRLRLHGQPRVVREGSRVRLGLLWPPARAVPGHDTPPRASSCCAPGPPACGTGPSSSPPTWTASSRRRASPRSASSRSTAPSTSSSAWARARGSPPRRPTPWRWIRRPSAPGRPCPACPDCGALCGPTSSCSATGGGMAHARTSRSSGSRVAGDRAAPQAGHHRVRRWHGHPLRAPLLRARPRWSTEERSIRINVREPRVPSGGISLPLKALEALKGIAEELQRE